MSAAVSLHIGFVSELFRDTNGTAAGAECFRALLQIVSQVMEMYFSQPSKLRWLSSPGPDGPTISDELTTALLKSK